MFEKVLNTQANRGMHLQRFDFRRREKAYLGRLFTDLDFTSNDTATETERELLTYLTI